MMLILLSTFIAIFLPAFFRSRAVHLVFAVCMPFLMMVQLIVILLFQESGISVEIPYAIIIAFSFAEHYLKFAMAICVLWFFASIYSVFYITKKYGSHKLAKFMPFYNMAVCASIFIALAGNLVTTFIFYEILTFATLPLVGFSGDEKSKVGLKKYTVILSFCAVLFFLPSVIILQSTFDTTEFTPYVGTVSSMFFEEIASQNFEQYKYIPSSKLMVFALILLMFGVAKSAIFPFNGWLPAAMCAPAPVSALLHAVAVVKSGVFIMYKIIYEFFGTQYFLYLNNLFPLIFQTVVVCVVFGIVYASFLALKTHDIKKILAYSTISGMTYIFLLFFVGTENAMQAGFVQMGFHAVTKIGLFFIAGIVYLQYHTNDYTKMTGALSKSPILYCAIILFVFSMIGMPLTSGFVVKKGIIDVLVEEKAYISLFGIMFSGIMSAIYLVKPMLYFLTPVKSKIMDSNIISIVRYAVLPIVTLNIGLIFVIMFFL